VALWERLRQSIGWSGTQLDDLTRHRLIRRLIGMEVSALLEATGARIEAASLRSPEDLQNLDHNVVKHAEDFVVLNQQLKDFLYSNMYQHFRVVRMHGKAERIVEDLFKAYVEKPEILPPETQLKARQFDPYRTVCDYLAGMTDRFAIQEHRKLFEPETLP
jgi:dGTPase